MKKQGPPPCGINQVGMTLAAASAAKSLRVMWDIPLGLVLPKQSTTHGDAPVQFSGTLS
jgi:hypothetical protein